MADLTYYYLKTVLSPLLALAVCLCVLKFCCRICRNHTHTHTDLELSHSDHVYVIPIPVNDTQERRDLEGPDSRPPPYELVSPLPAYEESCFKSRLHDDHVFADSQLDSPPPPYTPSPAQHFYSPPAEP